MPNAIILPLPGAKQGNNSLDLIDSSSVIIIIKDIYIAQNCRGPLMRWAPEQMHVIVLLSNSCPTAASFVSRNINDDDNDENNNNNNYNRISPLLWSIASFSFNCWVQLFFPFTSPYRQFFSLFSPSWFDRSRWILVWWEVLGVAGLKRFWWTLAHFFGEHKFSIADISGIF